MERAATKGIRAARSSVACGWAESEIAPGLWS